MDDNNPQDRERLLNQLRKMIGDGVPDIAVGDTVKFPDDPQGLVYVHKAKTGENLDFVDINIEEESVQMRKEPAIEFMEDEYVVLDNESDFTFNCGMCEKDHRSTLEIASVSTGEQYYVAEFLVEKKQ